MKLDRKYQARLGHQRFSTNIITSSWAIRYQGIYVCGATYNGVDIMSACFPCGLQIFSKSLARMQAMVRAYNKQELEV
jgi:hypothetical protein